MNTTLPVEAILPGLSTPNFIAPTWEMPLISPPTTGSNNMSSSSPPKISVGCTQPETSVFFFLRSFWLRLKQILSCVAQEQGIFLPNCMSPTPLLQQKTYLSCTSNSQWPHSAELQSQWGVRCLCTRNFGVLIFFPGKLSPETETITELWSSKAGVTLSPLHASIPFPQQEAPSPTFLTHSDPSLLSSSAAKG